MTAGLVFVTITALYAAYSRGNNDFDMNRPIYSQIYPKSTTTETNSVTERGYPAAAPLKRTNASIGPKELDVSKPLESKPTLLTNSDWPLSFPAPNFTPVNQSNTSIGYSDYTCRFHKWMVKIANKDMMRG
jgi:hypothetical protein